MNVPNPFDLDQPEAYARWRAAKLAAQPRRIEDLIVDVADPRRLSDAERNAILQLCARANMAIYRSPFTGEDKELPRLLGRQLGLERLDANWLADEDGISSIAVAQQPPTPLRVGPPQGDHPAWGGPAPEERQGGARADFIPYTNRPIKWHTDGYYHPQARRILGMILHCVRPAREGGDSALADHDMIYIALRDANPQWVRALMADDAMTIPARMGEDGVARPAQGGPVFSVLPDGSGLHMRYTARTRSIEWKNDPDTRAAVAALESLLAAEQPWLFRTRLAPGMGLVCNNVPHERTAFADDAAQPRLLYRARYLDRVALPADWPRSALAQATQEALV
jgi:alpha-ketoglutarate-dependent taurine dioxygenase